MVRRKHQTPILLLLLLLVSSHLPGVACFLVTSRPALLLPVAPNSDGVGRCSSPADDGDTTITALAATSATRDAAESLRDSDQRPVRRVAIIGAGIAGLSLAHALHSTATDDLEVIIFDSRSGPLDYTAGAGVQINGGASVLLRISPELHGKVVRAALPLGNIRSRAKPWFQSDTTPNAFSTLLEINLESAIRSAGGDAEKALIVDGEVQAFTIMRGALQKILLEALPSTTRVELGKRLTNIRATDDGDGATCIFNNDESSGPFDIVCGCDGIQSAVKQYVDTHRITDEAGSKQNALYSGIRIRYSMEDCPEQASDVAELRQYFGDGAYGLFGTYGAGEGETRKRGAYLIFNDRDYIGPFPKKKAQSEADTIAAPVEATEAADENAEWTEVGQRDTMKADTLLRMKESGLPDEELRPVVEAADKFFELGVYFHNPFSFQGWSRKVKGTEACYACLLGDSSHAMPPFLGQGANQAIQDAYCLATKIAEHNAIVSQEVAPGEEAASTDAGTGRPTTLGRLLKEYETLRWLPTTSITLKSIFLGYLETGGEGLPSKLRDGVFFTLGKLGIATKVFLDGATPRV